MKKEFVATAYVVHAGRLLLIKHRKLGKWLPIGGHLEENESPDEAVLREVREETGLDAEIVGETLSGGSEETVEVLHVPNHVQLETLNHGTGLHQHVDLIYLCRAKHANARLNEEEGTELKWFTEKEFDSKEIPHNVRFFGKIALKKIRE
jgi:8-oxo-dGTP pyrophosphatase MutT (NUDIX family)